MSTLLFAELAATCNALGYYDGIKYHKDVHCLETIKDLIRYLRRDDDNHEIRRYLGEANIVKTDILPILKDYSEDKYLFDVILRLLVNLTNPVLILFREELPEDKTTRNYYLQMIGHLQSYKESFVDEAVWTILGKKLGDILQIEWQERDEDANLSIMRILTLARNILQVPADPLSEKRPDNDASLHDQILWSFHVSGLVDIFLYIACSENEEQYYMHILEIVSQMLREQNPAQIAVAAAQRSLSEQQRDESELLAIRKRELQARQDKIRKFAGARHSRFMGTYTVKNVTSISDRDIIYHRPLNNLESLDLDRDKKKLKLHKNRMPLKEESNERRSAFSIRLFLKEFCVEFLNGAYNNLMYRVKQSIVGGESQPNDESYYLWALKFFMEFNRCYKFKVGLVSETISIQTFHFVQSQIENYFEMLKVDKKKIPIWSRRLHVGIKAYQELLMTLGAMIASPDEKIKQSAQVIKSNIFYVVEYRELCLTLIKSYEPVKMSLSFLQDLIKTIHIFMKLLEDHCRSNRTVLVQKKKVKRGKGKGKKKKTAAAQEEETAENRVKNLEEQWEEIGPQLSAVLQGEFKIPDNIVPFDATSDVGIDDQRADAMRRIQDFLRQQKSEEAIGLLRASREVWPENDYFGNSFMAPEEEFIALRDIFFADIHQTNQNDISNNEQTSEVQPEEEDENEERYSEDEEENEEGPSHNMSVDEQSFQFNDFLKRFANTRVIQPCARLLRNFKTNPPKVNHCIIRLMHRVAVECCLPALFFQASLFRTFQLILDEYKLSASRSSTSSSNGGEREKVLKELAKFSVFIVRKFTEVAQKNPKAFMELLFWKTSRDAYDIEVGYGTYQEKTASAKAVWSEEQEDEIRRLCEEFREKGVPESDLADEVHKNIINKERSKIAVTKKMKELGLITSKPSRKLSRAPKIWAEEEVAQLTALYEELKDSFDPVGMIMDRLDVKRSKNRIIEKLLSLGLANDRSELYKKRRSGAKEGKSKKSNRKNREDNSDSDERGSSTPDESSSSEEDVPKAITKPKKHPKTLRKGPSNVNLSHTEINKVIVDAVGQGLSAALEWLVESLEEAAEEEGDESVPLLPISEEAVLAMDIEHFQKVLKVLGIVEPDGEQEVYWRIPANCNPRDLRTRAQVIDFILKNKIEENPGVKDSISTENNDMDAAFTSLLSGTTNDVSNETRKANKKRKHQHRSSSESSDDNLESFLQARRRELAAKVELEEKENTINNSISTKKGKEGLLPTHLLDSSYSSSPTRELIEESSLSKHKKKRKRLIHINDDSSDNEEITETTQVPPESVNEEVTETTQVQLESDVEDGLDPKTDAYTPSSSTHRRVKRLISDDESD